MSYESYKKCLQNISIWNRVRDILHYVEPSVILGPALYVLKANPNYYDNYYYAEPHPTLSKEKHRPAVCLGPLVWFICPYGVLPWTMWGSEVVISFLFSQLHTLFWTPRYST